MNDVEEVKSRLDIVDVISGYVPLKQAGRSYKGLSPFKNEKTPSFIVSPEKGIWHDFSSGRGGDVISFVMEMEGLSFYEALEMLAKKAGVKLTKRKSKESTNSKSRLYDAIEMAVKYYHLALSKNEKPKDYLIKNRGLSVETVKKFKLGYSPDSWESLSNYLVGKGFNRDELIAAGLSAKSNKGRGVYDVFRGRVMFPVFDTQLRPIGFSARLLNDAKAAKYINTPQTLVYNKSTAIYGLSQAKKAIRDEDRVVIVEGNMDVLSLHNYGFENVVACSGTALTEQQLRQLSRLTKNISLCFDSDEAGVNATIRAIDLSSMLDVNLSIISLDDAKDPDELLKKDQSKWPELVKNAQYAPDFIINLAKSKFDTNSAPGKKGFITFVKPMLNSLKDQIELQHYSKKVAQLLDVSEDSIKKISSIKSISLTDLEPQSTVTEDNFFENLTHKQKAEQELLELILANPVTRPAIKDLDAKEISELHRDIFEKIKNSLDSSGALDFSELPKQDNYVKILSLRGEQNFADLTAHDKRLEAFTQVGHMQDLYRQETKKKLAKQLADSEAAGDTQKTKELLLKYQQLINEE